MLGRGTIVALGMLLSCAGTGIGVDGASAHDFSATGLNDFPDSDLPSTSQTSVDRSMPGVAVVEAVIDQYKLWDAGETLNVCFFGGEPGLRAFFVTAAQRWDEIASVNFDFGPAPNFRDCNPAHPSHIRVGFTATGSWSSVGTDSIRGAQSEPSLNIDPGGPFALVSQSALRGTILHELGHALGLQHEHQSPVSGCEAQLDFTVVYHDLEGPPNSWSKEKVDRNMRQLVASPRLRTTPYDPHSIMHYSLPATWFTNGTQSSCYVTRNNDLSQTDIAAVSSTYPATLQAQAEYIQVLDAQTALAIHDLNLQTPVLDQIQEQINSVVPSSMRDNGTVSDFRRAVVQVIGPNSNCSPAINIMTGNLTISCGNQQ